MLVPTVEQAKPVQSVEHLSLMPEAVVVVVSTGMVQEEPVVVEMALARVEVTAAPELSIPALVVEEVLHTVTAYLQVELVGRV